MRKIILSSIVVLLLIGVVNAQDDISDNAEYWDCYEEEGVYYCLQDTFLLNADTTFSEDVLCLTTLDCSTITCGKEDIDVGCFSTIKLKSDQTTEFWYKKITGDEIEDSYLIRTIPSSEEYDVTLDLKLVDFSKCSKYSGLLDGLECPYKDKEVNFDAGIVESSAGIEFVIYNFNAEGTGTFDTFGFISQNLIYIFIVVIIIAFAYFAFKPKSKTGKRKGTPI